MEGRIFFLPSSCSRARNVAPWGDIGRGSFLSGVRQSQLGRALFTCIPFSCQPKTTFQEETPGPAAQYFSAMCRTKRGKHGDRSSAPRAQRPGDGLELWGMMDGSGLLLSSVLMRCTNGNSAPWNAFSLRQETSAIYRQQEQEMRSSFLGQSLCREWEPRWRYLGSAPALLWFAGSARIPEDGAAVSTNPAALGPRGPAPHSILLWVSASCSGLGW